MNDNLRKVLRLVCRILLIAFLLIMLIGMIAKTGWAPILFVIVVVAVVVGAVAL